VKAEGNTLTLHVLLADASHDLRDVQIGALRAGRDHGLEAVPREEVTERGLASHIAGLVEGLVDLELESLHHVLAWKLLQSAGLSLVKNLLGLLVVLLESPANLVQSRLLGNDVLDTNCEAVLVEPVVDEKLGV
jgi:hypothetical protein